jgi:hypothetical protein
MRRFLLALLVSACSGELLDEGTGDENGTGDLSPPAEDPVADDGAAAHPAAVPVGADMLVLEDLRLRDGPGAEHAILHVMPRGALAVTVGSMWSADGWWNLEHDGETGWANAAYLAYVSADADPVAVGVRHPNAIFKRQVRHPVWNPTGPLTSGNCAPASLAMAARVLGAEPQGLTVEQSIDRVRVLMDKPSDSGGATRAQVQRGAERLGLSYLDMPDGDLDDQLDLGRVVVLEGMPGNASTATPTRYQRAFVDAGYAYTFDGRHSICVLGRSAGGGYVVADPLSKVGAITLTTAEMRDFSARWGGTGTALW